MSDQERDLARGLYGHDLTIAGASSGYHHRYNLTEITCFSLRDPHASWCLVNPTHQHTLATAPHTGLVLVRIPPTTRAGTGQLQLRIDGTPHADIDLTICAPCKRGVIEHVRTDPTTAAAATAVSSSPPRSA